MINKILDKLFNLEIIRTHPKEAIKFAREHFKGKEIIAIEIGVYKGENSEQMNKHLNIKKLYLIEPYKEYKSYAGIYEELDKAKKKAHKRNNKGNEIWIEQLSQDGIGYIYYNPDFIYIDGNHEYEYIKKDLELYWEILNKGGIIAGHDIQYDDISKAVLEFANKENVDVHFGDRRDWWIIK